MKAALAAALALSLRACASWRPAPAVPDEVKQAMEKAGLPLSALGVVAYPIGDAAHDRLPTRCCKVGRRFSDCSAPT